MVKMVGLLQVSALIIVQIAGGLSRTLDALWLLYPIAGRRS